MKFLVALLAVVATASAGTLNAREAVSTLSISSEIVRALEGVRDQMPCGFEKVGVPPLAPLKISHKDIAIDSESAKVNGEVNTIRVDGLNEFIIDSVTANPVTSRVKIQLTFPNISTKGLYGLAATLKSYGLTINIEGAGDLYLAIRDLVINIDVKYSLGLVSKQVKLKEVRIVINLGDVDSNIEGLMGKGFVNRKLNEIVEEFILLSVNDNQETITNFLDPLICNPVNKAIDGMSLADIIIAAGGGSGSEPTVCIPPQDI